MKVLSVDADPQSDVSAGFGYRDCDDSNETLTALMDAEMCIRDSICRMLIIKDPQNWGMVLVICMPMITRNIM